MEPTTEKVISRRGILLAGGRASRLYPATLATNKHLLPVYDKPLIYYGLSVLLQAGIREIALVTNPGDRERFAALLGDGEQFGIQITYFSQAEPRGIAHAVLSAAEFIGDASVALALGDNVFYGPQFLYSLHRASQRDRGATIFTCAVEDPGRYGVAEFDARGRLCGVAEKPEHPASDQAITGLYFYDNRVLDISAELEPSDRGELEITDVNRKYLELKALTVEPIGPEDVWFDAGTPDDLLLASEMIEKLQRISGSLIGCPEEVAFRKGFISADTLAQRAAQFENAYGAYLANLAGVRRA